MPALGGLVPLLRCPGKPDGSALWSRLSLDLLPGLVLSLYFPVFDLTLLRLPLGLSQRDLHTQPIVEAFTEETRGTSTHRTRMVLCAPRLWQLRAFTDHMHPGQAWVPGLWTEIAQSSGQKVPLSLSVFFLSICVPVNSMVVGTHAQAASAPERKWKSLSK